MFRPFPRAGLPALIPRNARVGVLDRNLSPGSGGMFWQEVVASLRNRPDVLVQDYIVGLGGGEVTPGVLCGIVDDLADRHQAVEPIFRETAA